MKTALVLYGFFRTFDYAKFSLKEHVIDPLNCDVFFHTPEYVYTQKKDEIQILHDVYSRHEKKVGQSEIDFFGANLKSHVIRPYDSQPYIDMLNQHGLSLFNETTKQHTWRTLSYFHNISLSMSLFKDYVEQHNEHYDLVILTRPDNMYYANINTQVIDFSKLNCPSHFLLWPAEPELQHFSKEERCLPSNRRRAGGAAAFGYNRWLNDQVLAGSQKNMMIYYGLFDKAMEYGKEGICFNQETFLAAHCLKNGYDFVGTDFVNYEIWRNDSPTWKF